MDTLTIHGRKPHSQTGVLLIELMFAGFILTVCSLGVISLIWTSILINNRNRVDSTQTMLAQSVIEQVNSTIIGSESSLLSDCNGKTWTISTTPGGAAMIGSVLDFNEENPPEDYFMTYVLKAPCESAGALQATYDVRWHVEIVGAAAGAPTNTFLVTVGAKKNGSTGTGLVASAPINMRVMVGN
jgi:hypothetical protein